MGSMDCPLSSGPALRLDWDHWPIWPPLGWHHAAHRSDEFIPSAAREIVPSETRNPMKGYPSVLSPRALLPVNNSVLHDELHGANRRDVLGGIAIHRDEIGKRAGLHDAQL